MTESLAVLLARLRDRRGISFAVIVYAMFTLWLLSMISVPIQRWMMGDGALPAAISLGVCFQALAVLIILVYGWGWGRALAVSGLVVTFGWAVEMLGHTSDFPFGGYAYTGTLQPQLGGVPLLIPLAWMMMMPPSWAVAHVITRRLNRRWRLAAFVLVTMLAFTAWDLFLDPQMVGWNLWAWDDPSGFTYFGIPWSNYAGWMLSVGLITLAVLPLLRLDRLPLSPLLQVYALTLTLEFIGLLVFWGMPGPALVGAAGMGVMLLWAVWALRRQNQRI
ncbi:MAG: carotenoid biosynthesis protein [Anaerolineae bacterium]